MSKGISYRIIPFVLVLLGFAVYMEALGAPFVYDDRGYIVFNDAIRSLENFAHFSGTRYIGFLSFALNYYIGGYTPFDYHLVNIIIHIINSILVFYLIVFTFRTPALKAADAVEGQALAAVSAFIFLTHPVETQAVTYITQRFTSLAVLFYLLSIVLYIKSRLERGRTGGRGGWPLYAMSLVFAVLAMKTKEISFTLPFVIFLYDFIFFRGSDTRTDWLSRVPFLLTLAIIPISLFGENSDPISENLRRLQLQEAGTLSREVYVYTQFSVIVTYIRLFFFPAWQKIDYDYPLSMSLFEPASFFSFLFLVALFAGSAFLLKKSLEKSNVWGILFSFGIAWFFICLSIESFAVPIQDVIFEHRAYLPSIGFIVSFVCGAFFLKNRFAPSLPSARAALVIILIVVPVLSALTYKRNQVWKDELTLVNDAIGERSGKARLYYIRAMIYIDREKFSEALEDAEKALKLKPESTEMHNLRGFVTSAMGRYAESLKDFTMSIRYDPGYHTAYYNRGRSYMLLDEYDKSITDFSRAIELRKNYIEAYNNRGVVYTKKGETEKAVSDFKKSCGMGSASGCENLKILRTAIDKGERPVKRAGD